MYAELRTFYISFCARELQQFVREVCVVEKREYRYYFARKLYYARRTNAFIIFWNGWNAWYTMSPVTFLQLHVECTFSQGARTTQLLKSSSSSQQREKKTWVRFYDSRTYIVPALYSNLLVVKTRDQPYPQHSRSNFTLDYFLSEGHHRFLERKEWPTPCVLLKNVIID